MIMTAFEQSIPKQGMGQIVRNRNKAHANGFSRQHGTHMVAWNFVLLDHGPKSPSNIILMTLVGFYY